jgi:quercetin dioxygenase-like cupin family protein
MFEKEDDELLRGSIVWLVPNAQKNRMEHILVTLGPGGRTAEFPAHDGEEFGYVLSGQIVLYTGNVPHQLSRGESFCLHPDAPHHVTNPGKHQARFLWTSTPPTF